MIVVADTSPLNYLIRLGYEDMLHEIYGQILVPVAVMRELRHPDAPLEVHSWASSRPEWLEEIDVTVIDETLAQELGAGEREAISLALERRADVLLIDERAGREQAIARNIPVAGTLAILLQAALLRRFDFPASLAQLKKFGFRVSPPVESTMLARWEAARKQ
jgi:predicted nucleic acid-binding protein